MLFARIGARIETVEIPTHRSLFAVLGLARYVNRSTLRSTIGACVRSHCVSIVRDTDRFLSADHLTEIGEVERTAVVITVAPIRANLRIVCLPTRSPRHSIQDQQNQTLNQHDCRHAHDRKYQGFRSIFMFNVGCCNSVRDTVQAQHQHIPRQRNGHHTRDCEP